MSGIKQLSNGKIANQLLDALTNRQKRTQQIQFLTIQAVKASNMEGLMNIWFLILLINHHKN